MNIQHELVSGFSLNDKPAHDHNLSLLGLWVGYRCDQRFHRERRPYQKMPEKAKVFFITLQGALSYKGPSSFLWTGFFFKQVFRQYYNAPLGICIFSQKTILSKPSLAIHCLIQTSFLFKHVGWITIIMGVFTEYFSFCTSYLVYIRYDMVQPTFFRLKRSSSENYRR